MRLPATAASDTVRDTVTSRAVTVNPLSVALRLRRPPRLVSRTGEFKVVTRDGRATESAVVPPSSTLSSRAPSDSVAVRAPAPLNRMEV